MKAGRDQSAATDVLEVVVAQRRAQRVVIVEAPVHAHLRTGQPLVLVRGLDPALAGRAVGGVLQRHHRQVAEQVEVTAVEVVLQVGGQAVEVQVVGEQRIAGPERIAEAATAHRHPVRRAVGQPGLVQPHILLAQAAAQLFGGRHRAITAAAGQAHAGGCGGPGGCSTAAAAAGWCWCWYRSHCRN
ncbi:hypothetical protein G6F24_015709 [Rhizopus arrhizus]|nr:hypothetical protein G6F24_015709 [Rhizopus arrhizus]